MSGKKKSERDEGDKQRNLNQRQPQRFVLRSSGVSHALWPLQARRYLATSKIAQQRRLMIIKGVWWVRKPDSLQYKQLIKQLLAFQSTFRIYLLYTTLAIAFLVVGVLLAVFMLRPWPVTVLLVLLWIATTALTIRLWYACLHMSLVAKQTTRYTVRQIAQHAVKQMPKQPLPIVVKARPQVIDQPIDHPINQSLPIIAKTRPLAIDHSISQPIPVTRPVFPSTPMPPTPLVRVLETIDLSTTNVEHFLEAKQDQHVPCSQMGEVPDSSLHRSDEHTGERIDIHMDEEA